MTHRIKKSSNSTNLEPITCDRYMARHLRKETKDDLKSQPSGKGSKQMSYNVSHLNKNGMKVQENLPLKDRKSCGSLLECLDDSHSFQPSIVSRQRSKSAAGHEPWGQLLKSERNSDKSSVFGSFDPLRTLHFLVKELQYQLKAILPDDNTVLQIVFDMNQALKRVPPEVASMIHLQQSLDRLPNKSYKPVQDVPEKLKSTFHKGTQTSLQDEDNEKIQKIMVENSRKLEESCRQMEAICMNLKTEKENLESQLKFERDNVIFYKKRIEDLEKTNNHLNIKLRSLEKEKEEMTVEIERLKISSATEHVTLENKLKLEITGLKNSKSNLEQELSKLKHQLKLCSLEKEKYSAILSVRNEQINVMKTEMLQLHEVISNKFLDLQKQGMESMPTVKSVPDEVPDVEKNKENIGDGTISTIHSEHEFERPCVQKQNFKDLSWEILNFSNI